MSPHVTTFVSDLVQMAKAMEQVPQLEAELDKAHADIETYAKSLQSREMAIVDYKQQIEALTSKLRSLEVERDDAMFRELEAQDKVGKALSAIRSFNSVSNGLIAELDPPKPEPMREEPKVDDATWHNYDDVSSQADVGQSDLPPQASALSTGDEPQSPPVPTPSVEPQSDAVRSYKGQGEGPLPVQSTENQSPNVSSVQTSGNSEAGNSEANVSQPEQVSLPKASQSEPAPINPTPPVHSDPEQVSARAVDEDTEPTKYDGSGNIRQAWLQWDDRQYDKRLGKYATG